MKVKELKAYLDKVDDDFEVIIGAYKLVPEKKLNPQYPYPYDHYEFALTEGDIGYSSKTIRLDIDLDNNID